MNSHSWIKTTIPEFSLRFAVAQDVPLILQFIKDLAEYEKLSNDVVATEQNLRNNLFEKNAFAEVILGFYKGEPASFALFFHNFSTFLGKPGLYLEDLFVREEFRGKGIGKTMLIYLAKLAAERGCGRLEWWVLDWNEPAIQFYKNLGAEAMDEWTVYRISGQTLLELANESVIE